MTVTDPAAEAMIDKATLDAVVHEIGLHADMLLNWDYNRSRPALVKLYETAKTSQWNASSDLDWSIDVDWDALAAEQPALACTGLITATVPWIDAKYYAATQVMDEARHVAVFARCLEEKTSGTYPINPHLGGLLGDIIQDGRWDITYHGKQIMAEGLALAAFGFMHMLTTEPLLKKLLRYVISDEARHVAFRVLSLQEYYKGLNSAEIRERQEFAYEAAVKLHRAELQEVGTARRRRRMAAPAFRRTGNHPVRGLDRYH